MGRLLYKFKDCISLANHREAYLSPEGVDTPSSAVTWRLERPLDPTPVDAIQVNVDQILR